MKNPTRRPWAVTLSSLAALGLAATAFAHEGQVGAISAGKLAKDAKNYYGQTVTVEAKVEDVFDNHSFTLDEDALFAGPDVLVLVPHGLANMPVHEQKAMVTGTVRPYVTADLKRDLDFFDEGKIINKTVKIDYNTRPVLIASRVTTADGRDLLTGSATAMGDSDVATEATRPVRPREIAPDTMITATKLVGDAKKYYGQTVSVQSEVEDVLSPNAFTLDEDAVFKGPDVLVLVPRGIASQLRHDEKVTVTGTVRPWVVADLDKDLEFFQNGKIVSTKEKVDWKTRPVIVATSVTTADGRELLAQ